MKILKKIGYILLFVFLIPYQVINVFKNAYKNAPFVPDPVI